MQVKLDNPSCRPVRANQWDAGLDLLAKEDTVMLNSERVLVKTGVSVKIPFGYVGLLFPRSSLSKRSLIMTNSVGVIDSEYRGEIMASLMYTGVEKGITINKGERIVQLVVMPIALPELEIVYKDEDPEWNDTARGMGGFGSTGV